MKTTRKYVDDIIALIDFFQKTKAGQDDVWSDTSLSKGALGSYGEFVATVRKWDGGKPAPTLTNLGKLEDFIRDQLSEKEIEEFEESRA